MKKLLLVLSVLLLLNPIMAHSESSHSDFSDVEPLIDAKTPCSELSDQQLERIGDFYMEQMQPGEAHERMDAMMGGEGSESLKQAHIHMANNLYCQQVSAGPFVMHNRFARPGSLSSANDPFVGLGLIIIGFWCVLYLKKK